jgi:hypothetical protein
MNNQHQQRSESSKKLATNTIIHIHYALDETGPAELLGQRLARILDAPLLTDELFQGDIVRLDRTLGDGDGYPRISKVVHTRFPARTYLAFDNDAEFFTLNPILAILGAECHLILPADNDTPGTMIVGDQEDLDPVALANAIGMSQTPPDDDEPTTEDENGHASNKTPEPHTTAEEGPDVPPQAQRRDQPENAELCSRLNHQIHELCRQQGWKPLRVAMAAFLNFVENDGLRAPMLERLNTVERTNCLNTPIETEVK